MMVLDQISMTGDWVDEMRWSGKGKDFFTDPLCTISAIVHVLKRKPREKGRY